MTVGPIEASAQRTLQQLQHSLSFDVIKPLQESERFNVYLIKHENEQRVLKFAVDPELTSNLERDIHMSMFLMTLGRANARATYRVRNIYTYNRGWFIGQYFDAPVLLEAQSNKPDKEKIAVAKDIWGPFLAETSSYTPYFLQQRPYNISEQGMYTKQYYERHKELVGWAEAAKKKGLINQAEIRRILDYIEGNARMITNGLELIDVKPWDAFRLEDDVVGLVDLEYVTIVGRQYFDVAWSYLRFWADSHSPKAASAFLESFIDQSGIDTRAFAPPFLTAFGMKLLGYLYDTADYLEKADTTGEAPPYGPEEMAELLQNYLQFDINGLV